MPDMTLVVRSRQRADDALQTLLRAVQRADPDLPPQGLMTMEEGIGAVLLPARLGGAVLGAFGVLALVLAAVGLYGVMAYLVAQRAREMGIRMALGARPGEVMTMVLRRGMGVALAGMLIGVVAAAAVTRFAASLLYGISPTDPLTFAGVFLLLSLVAFAACLVPARRAAAVDPAVALRYE
jgi:ABC-type antimicrobial peptide transport system permease subunit